MSERRWEDWVALVVGLGLAAGVVWAGFWLVHVALSAADWR